jgi:predicted lipid-binding transport protein (Tim44 family)
MGKVGRVVLAVAGVAVALVPGLGTAISSAIYGGLAGGAVGGMAAAALTFGQVVAGGLALYGVSTAFGLVASIFTSGPPKPEPATRQERQPTPLRFYIAGARRGYGSLVRRH